MTAFVRCVLCAATVPGVPRRVRVLSNIGTSVKVAWEAGPNGGSPLTEYLVQYMMRPCLPSDSGLTIAATAAISTVGGGGANIDSTLWDAYPQALEAALSKLEPPPGVDSIEVLPADPAREDKLFNPWQWRPYGGKHASASASNVLERPPSSRGAKARSGGPAMKHSRSSDAALHDSSRASGISSSRSGTMTLEPTSPPGSSFHPDVHRSSVVLRVGVKGKPTTLILPQSVLPKALAEQSGDADAGSGGVRPPKSPIQFSIPRAVTLADPDGVADAGAGVDTPHDSELPVRALPDFPVPKTPATDGVWKCGQLKVNDTKAMLPSLGPQTFVQFRVIPKNAAGYGMPSFFVQFYVPDAPEATASTTNSLTITFGKFRFVDLERRFQSYEVQYQCYSPDVQYSYWSPPADPDAKWLCAQPPGNYDASPWMNYGHDGLPPPVVVKGLQPGTRYRFRYRIGSPLKSGTDWPDWATACPSQWFATVGAACCVRLSHEMNPLDDARCVHVRVCSCGA